MSDTPLRGQPEPGGSEEQAALLAAEDGRLRGLELKGRYRQQDRPLDTFLIPALQVAWRYDRIAGYFTAGSLHRAAAGLWPFLCRGGAIRMVVNAELGDGEVHAIQQGLEVRQALADRLEGVAFPEHEPDWPDTALGLLAVLVGLGQLDIKVAVPLDPHDPDRPLPADEARPLHHSKEGVLTDAAGDQVAFSGSNNETVSGWDDNYETFDVYPSWQATWEGHGAEIVEDFREHWEDGGPPNWRTYPLPEAARRNLIRAANPDLLREAAQLREDVGDPEQLLRDWGLEHLANVPSPGEKGEVEPLEQLLTAPQRIRGVGLATAVVDSWPHQIAAARRVTGDWPCSRLLADQVGLGKTIEVALMLRELLASHTIGSALILAPASVLHQWQGELWERATLWVPRLLAADGRLEWPDRQQTRSPEGWQHRPVVLASSHLARRREHQPALKAGRWDLVIVDEAHHARRRGSDPRRADANLMLQLLRGMRDAGCWQGLLLATATPMQMHPHEAWDLLDLCGLPEEWGRPERFAAYYRELAKPPRQRDWKLLRDMHAAWRDMDGTPDPVVDEQVEGLRRTTDKWMVRYAADERPEQLEDKAIAYPDVADVLDLWLREHTPLRTLTLRATRHLLRAYEANGMLPEHLIIPKRQLADVRIELTDDEQALYDRIEQWIRRSYNAHLAEGQKALGFVMTVYRRRLTSSFAAIEASLKRRLDALDAGERSVLDSLDADDRAALEAADARHDDLLATDAVTTTGAERDDIAAFLDAIRRRPSIDSKFDRLYDELQTLFAARPERTVIIFTEFTDTMDWLRAELVRVYGADAVACYSGRGGEQPPDGDPGVDPWQAVSKQAILDRLRRGELRVLVGTDAMSEGLNLQTADVAVNFDLPWNFMRIEQRIGRVDRIGGHPTVHIRNLVVENTVEQKVYDTIAADHDEFVDLIGPAAPVLGGAEDAIADAAMSHDPSDADRIAVERARKLVAQAREPDPAADGLTRDDRLARAPIPGSEPTAGEDQHAQHSWHARVHQALRTDRRYAERLTATDTPEVYRYHDEAGVSWPVTFTREIADDSAGSIGMLTWQHPAFPARNDSWKRDR